ncbi:MAG: radical SAM protein [Candidatus Omnitrophica bacterium]|jgi:MoaA/NifB/PqqE/SkfB family radical SAM enzyme|nr:radical SAM protein [Candidatus Omnitrophota bacterium]
MANTIKEQDWRINTLKEDIITSVNKRVAGAVTNNSAAEKNLLLNDFEYSTGKLHLESSPEGIGIGAHYNCNAKCIFCLGGKPRVFSLERYKNFFEPKLSPFISKARYLNLCGFGELLLMPGIEEFLDYVNERTPGVNKIYTTNGTPLINSEFLTALTKGKSAIEVSLHAPQRQLHKALTRLDAFDQITAGIKRLTSLRKHKGYPTVVAVFLINTLNIESLPAFVEFAAELGVDRVICNYMTVFHRAHLKFSCFFKQEITNDSFKRAEEIAQKLNFEIILPPKFGLDNNGARQSRCSDPWKYFYVENESSVLPCCFAGEHVGYLEKAGFDTIWNGSHYKNLRNSLIQGRPSESCRYCYKYHNNNVNDIRSHINSRPGFRDEILKGHRL